MFPYNLSRIAAIAGVCGSMWHFPKPMQASGLETNLEAIEHNLTQTKMQRQQLGRATELASKELTNIKRQGVLLAQIINTQSARASRLEIRLKTLGKEWRVKSEKMAKRKKQLAAILAALQRLARMPTATLIAMPQTQDDTIRSAILLNAAIPKLRRASLELAGDLRTLASLRTEIYEKKKRLSATLESMDSERRKLASLTVEKLLIFNSIRKQKSGAARRAALLSAKAGTLRDLLANLVAQKNTMSLVNTDFHPTPDQGGLQQNTASVDPFTNLQTPLPVPGRIVLAFGDKRINGTRSRGVAIATRAGALVVAPLVGKVVFAGTFLGYRNLVILELPNRRHALISGMSEITAELGDEVMAGEPLGTMPSSTAATPKLYFEVRSSGRPIDPVPQITKTTNKARG